MAINPHRLGETVPQPGEAPALSDAQLMVRYRATYGIPASAELSADQIRHHLELELRLTSELLASNRSNRWEIFERSYSSLYEGLPWLAVTGAEPDVETWKAVLGRPPMRIYEIGSGSGRLAVALAEAGYEVEATDITRQRGGERPASSMLTWTVTDGINLDRFASRATYDAVISDQVVEHLHPDDILDHLRGCRRLLRPGGRYVFQTPHTFTGPHDVSRVFGFSRPVGMHLREYTNRELLDALRAAGFASAGAVLRPPRAFPAGLGTARVSRAYLRYLLTLERAMGKLPDRRRRPLAMLLRGPLRPRIFLVAE